MKQLYQFYNSMTVIILYASVILVDDVTYFSLGALMYINFACVLIIPSSMTFSSAPSDPDAYPDEAKYTPSSNVFSFNNHLLFWGSVIFSTGSIYASYYYFKSTK